jgi:hypothetical protein
MRLAGDDAWPRTGSGAAAGVPATDVGKGLPRLVADRMAPAVFGIIGAPPPKMTELYAPCPDHVKTLTEKYMQIGVTHVLT